MIFTILVVFVVGVLVFFHRSRKNACPEHGCYYVGEVMEKGAVVTTPNKISRKVTRYCPRHGKYDVPEDQKEGEHWESMVM